MNDTAAAAPGSSRCAAGRLFRGLLLLALLATSAWAQEWARFRGPDGAGLGAGAAIPATFALDGVRWRVKLPGRGHSSPVLWGDRVFVTVEGPELAQRRVVCLRAADGTLAWERSCDFTPHEQHRFNSFASSTPAVDGQRVYLLWSSGEKLVAMALDHEGEPLWRRELGAFRAQHGSAVSPVVVDDVLVVANDHEGEGSFLAGLDVATGETRWRRERTTARASYATPIVRRDGERTDVVFASTAHGITCLDPRTGALRWETGAGFTERFVGTPAVAGDVLFCAAGSGGGGKESLAIALPAVGATTAPTELYRPRRALPYVPSPIGVGSRFFLFGDGGVLSCLRADDGELIWRDRVDGGFYGSPVAVGDRLYAISRSGVLFVVAAADEFRLLGSVDLGEPSSATPAVAGGVLYLRTETHLIAVRGKP